MREIKFRSWDKENKEMVEINGDYLYLADNKVYEIYESSYAYQTYMDKKDMSDRYIPLQYTGLKDNNGKEIYEGDVVRLWGGEYYQGYWEHDLKVIIKDMIDDCFMMGESEHLKIIGNKYENPELLK